jgi:hypothetical protein
LRIAAHAPGAEVNCDLAAVRATSGALHDFNATEYGANANVWRRRMANT